MKWFELGLVVLTFATGLVWLLDRLFLARRRAARDGLLAEEPVLVDYSRAFFPVLAAWRFRRKPSSRCCRWTASKSVPVWVARA